MQNGKVSTAALLAVCAVATLAACGSPANPAIAVPGGADLTIGAPERSGAAENAAGGEDGEGLAAGAASPGGFGAASPDAGPGDGAADPQPLLTHPATTPTMSRSGTRKATTTRQTPTSSVTTRPKTTTSHPDTKGKGGTPPGTGKATSTASPLTLGPGTPTTDEAEVTRLVNVERVAAGCAPLIIHPLLTQVARAHSQTMTAPGGFKHNSPDGRTPFQRLTAVGYEYRIAGENIAAGQPTPAAIVQALTNSPEHKANLLDCRFTQVGVGKAYVTGSEYGTYWTQDLATPM